MELSDSALTTKDNIPDHMLLKIEQIGIETEQLINVASEKIENYCNREFKLDTRQEKYQGKNSKWLLLNNWPVHEVIEIKYYEEAIDDYDVNKNGHIYRSAGWNGSKDSEKYNIEVEYKAGYKLPGEDDRDLPEQIEFACILLVKSLFDRMMRDLDISSKQVPDFSEVYFNPNMLEGMPVPVQNLLNDYKRQLV